MNKNDREEVMVVLIYLAGFLVLLTLLYSILINI